MIFWYFYMFLLGILLIAIFFAISKTFFLKLFLNSLPAIFISDSCLSSLLVIDFFLLFFYMSFVLFLLYFKQCLVPYLSMWSVFLLTFPISFFFSHCHPLSLSLSFPPLPSPLLSSLLFSSLLFSFPSPLLSPFPLSLPISLARSFVGRPALSLSRSLVPFCKNAHVDLYYCIIIIIIIIVITVITIIIVIAIVIIVAVFIITFFKDGNEARVGRLKVNLSQKRQIEYEAMNLINVGIKLADTLNSSDL